MNTPLDLIGRRAALTNYPGPAMLLAGRVPGRMNYASPASYWWGPEMVRPNSAYRSYTRSGVILYCRPDSRYRYR